ncbi:MAG: UDP-glucose 4-epimerase GalE [Gammaproteobacteria bacterium]|nr:UDP-glucose 4-epimerase GalE [Gammaproteobacteria bacterium]
MPRVLIVGGAGYIGSHMVKYLGKKGAVITVLDNLSTGHRDLVTAGEFIEGDLGDQALLDTVFASRDIDVVMHFAASSLVGESVIDPLKYYTNNVSRTANLLSAMQRHEIKHFIFSSTAAVYGEPDELPITEQTTTNPTNPYGATKLAVERMLRDCDAAFGLKSICLRYFNACGADDSATIGERHQPETHLIPLVLQVAAGLREHISVFGNDYETEDGTCLRDYVHVNDLAQAHYQAMMKLLDGGESNLYNLGNSTGFSVRQVIDQVSLVTGKKINVVDAPRRVGDPAVLVADSTKARRELAWQPQYESLSMMIETAWSWHQRDSS